MAKDMMLLFPTFTKTAKRHVAAHPDRYGFLVVPGHRNPRAVLQTAPWAYDNGAYSGLDVDQWQGLAQDLAPCVDTCLFAVVPDTVGHHAITRRQWNQYAPLLKALGYPLAFVAQDGCTPLDPPWSQMTALFVGGTDRFKDNHSVPVIREAQRRGKWVHVGRVNWRRRVHFCLELGIDSIDGTAFGRRPDKHLALYQTWVQEWQRNGRLDL